MSSEAYHLDTDCFRSDFLISILYPQDSDTGYESAPFSSFYHLHSHLGSACRCHTADQTWMKSAPCALFFITTLEDSPAVFLKERSWDVYDFTKILGTGFIVSSHPPKNPLFVSSVVFTMGKGKGLGNMGVFGFDFPLTSSPPPRILKTTKTTAGVLSTFFVFTTSSFLRTTKSTHTFDEKSGKIHTQHMKYLRKRSQLCESDRQICCTYLFGGFRVSSGQKIFTQFFLLQSLEKGREWRYLLKMERSMCRGEMMTS